MVAFMIVGKSEPLYEIEFGKTPGEIVDELAYLHQFILYSSLDMINSTMWSNNATFLRVVDKFNFLLVSAYATPGGKIFLLLHNGKGEDAVRAFFTETYEMYVKYSMNPFAIAETQIISPQFDNQVRNLAKKLFN